MARWPLAYPLSIGRVQAGDWASAVPDLLVAEGRLGVALDEPVEARARPRSRTPWPRRATPTRGCATTRSTVEWWGGQFASGRLPGRSDLADRVAAAHARGRAAAHAGRSGAPYGSDLRLLSRLGGIPTLHYGPGRRRAGARARRAGAAGRGRTPRPAPWPCSPSTSAASPDA